MSWMLKCSCGKEWMNLQGIPFHKGQLSGDPGLKGCVVDLAEPDPLGGDSVLLLPAREDGPGEECLTRMGLHEGHKLEAVRCE